MSLPTPLPKCEVERLAVLHAFDVLDTPPEPAFDRITSRLARLMKVPVALVTLVTEDRQWFKSCFGTTLTGSDRESSFCQFSIQGSEIFVVEDAARDPRFCDNPFVTGPIGLRFYAGAPLRTASGHSLGSLCVIDTKPRQLTEDEASLMQDLAAMVVDALELRLAGRRLQEAMVEREKAQATRTRELQTFNLELGAAMRENYAFSAAIRCSVVGVLITDASLPDNPTLFINPAFEQITGYCPDDVVGKNCRFLQGPDSSPEMIHQMRMAIGERRPFRGLIRNYRKDGKPFWNELAIDPVFDEGGRLIHFVGLQNDVTDRVDAQIALRQSEARKAAILEASLDAVITIDHNGRVLEINPAASSIFGYSEVEMLGEIMSDLIVPSKMREAHNQGMRHFLSTGDGPALGRRLELPAMRSDGSEFPVELTITRIHAEGAPMFTGYLRDITTRKRSEEALQLAKEEAERANTAKSDFLSRMSHELRTPLNAILGFSQLLQRRSLEPRHAESVGFIAKAGRHLLDLVNEVLDLSRIEAGHTSWSPEPVLVVEVLQESLDLVQALARERSVVLAVDPSVQQSWCCVNADRQRLKQIIINLLTNGVKYNRECGRLTVRCEAVGALVAIDFVDTGMGIPTHQINRLFVPFERLDAERTGVEGSGIGLALTQRLVTMMGGSIEVRSELHEGSTFRVLLPQAVGTTPEKMVTAAPPQPVSAEAVHTVLYVEDHPANIRLMEHVAAEHGGIRLVTTGLGREAVQLARQYAPDLILLDLHLPDISGDQVLRLLRGEPSFREVPIFMVSADAMTKQVARLLEQGATGYITKPIEVEAMLNHFHEHLGVTV